MAGRTFGLVTWESHQYTVNFSHRVGQVVVDDSVVEFTRSVQFFLGCSQATLNRGLVFGPPAPQAAFKDLP